LNPLRESVEKRAAGRCTPQGAQADTAKNRLMSDNNENKPAPALEPAVMRAIGRELRAMYNDIIAEGVPERFAEILRRTSRPTKTRKTSRRRLPSDNCEGGAK
jgi:Anti-sigma factor NepR